METTTVKEELGQELEVTTSTTTAEEVAKNYALELTKIPTPEKRYITWKSKRAMINIHSEKYIAAYLNKIQYAEKIKELQRDWDTLSEEAKARVNAFIDKRLANPDAGKMLPEAELQQAVSVRLSLDGAINNAKQAEMEFVFYGKLIDQIKAL